MPGPVVIAGDGVMTKADRSCALRELVISEAVTEAGRVLSVLLLLPGSLQGCRG